MKTTNARLQQELCGIVVIKCKVATRVMCGIVAIKCKVTARVMCGIVAKITF